MDGFLHVFANFNSEPINSEAQWQTLSSLECQEDVRGMCWQKPWCRSCNLASDAAPLVTQTYNVPSSSQTWQWEILKWNISLEKNIIQIWDKYMHKQLSIIGKNMETHRSLNIKINEHAQKFQWMQVQDVPCRWCSGPAAQVLVGPHEKSHGCPGDPEARAGLVIFP